MVNSGSVWLVAVALVGMSVDLAPKAVTGILILHSAIHMIEDRHHNQRCVMEKTIPPKKTISPSTTVL
jgi:hypothetical protein